MDMKAWMLIAPNVIKFIVGSITTLEKSMMMVFMIAHMEFAPKATKE
jgi:hypothetical protein